MARLGAGEAVKQRKQRRKYLLKLSADISGMNEHEHEPQPQRPPLVGLETFPGGLTLTSSNSLWMLRLQLLRRLPARHAPAVARAVVSLLSRTACLRTPPAN